MRSELTAHCWADLARRATQLLGARTWIRRPGLVLATGRVYARVWQYQSRNGFPANDMRFDDLVHVSRCDSPVPNSVRIDHEIRSMFALIKTTGLIGPHFTLEASFLQFLFE